MAEYSYDESGSMAAYFLITFLALVLIPLTYSLLPSPTSAKSSNAQPLCQCGPCTAQRLRTRPPKFQLPGKKVSFVILGWGVLAFVAWRVAGAKSDTEVYDPFEILGIARTLTEKEIKSHYKKLSKLYHPDKVKATVEETLEMIQDRFVTITKAYKSLTDPVIRENWEKYGNPDGRQEMSMGIALPAWIVAGSNNIYVLGAYGLIFGGLLPSLVGRWWFGNRKRTKEGIQAESAAAFFKGLTEESKEADVVRVLASSYAFEHVPASKTGTQEVQAKVKEVLGDQEWAAITGESAQQKRAMVLLYAYLLRLDIDPALSKEQSALVLQTPLLLNALLMMAQSRNWLTPSLAIMRLHAFIAQALAPTSKPENQLAQLPGVKVEESGPSQGDYPEFVQSLQAKSDGRVSDVRKALNQWGRVEVVDVAFRVIGERIIVPSSIVYLVVKLRVVPPGAEVPKSEELDANETKKQLRALDEREKTFLNSRKDAEDLLPGQTFSGGAHAPFWPGTRKPNWWIVLADDKSDRVVVPPLKVAEIPFRTTGDASDFRAYKIQFQAPQNTGLLTWRVYVISDTFVGEETHRDIIMKIDDVSALTADEQGVEDDISDPEEDSIAGQMAMMKGGSVKQAGDARDEESDEESSTDDDEDSDSSSDSDSD